MSPLDNNNKFFWYIVVLVGLFILVLFTRNEFMGLQVNLDEKYINEQSLIEQRDEVQRLTDIKNSLANWDDNYDIEKYLINFSEDEIIDYIYSEIESDNIKYTDWIVTIKNISISDWIVNEMWFKESLITLNLRVPSETRMYKVLDFFADEDSKYKFFIDSFSFPNMVSESSFNITLPLKVFYK